MTPQTMDIPVEVFNGSALQDSDSSGHTARAGQIQYLPAGTGQAWWGPGTQMTFIATGKQTGGAFFLAEMSVPPGGGPPPHIHRREDESFRVLEGTLAIEVGADTIAASAGDFAYLPRGIAHAFRNTGEAVAKVLVMITPAGLENYFAEIFTPVADAAAPPPPVSKELIARAIAAAPKYGLELLPPA